MSAIGAVFCWGVGVRGRGGGGCCCCAREDGVEVEFFCEPVLPGCFGPPANDILANAVESRVQSYHVKYPVREQVDVRVAVRGEHFYPSVLPDQAVAEREALFLFRDIA